MAQYRIVKYVDDSNYGAYHFNVEKKVLWWWTKMFKTKYNLGRFMTFDDAREALINHLVGFDYRIIHQNGDSEIQEKGR